MSLKYFLLKRYRDQLDNLSHPSHNKSVLPKLLKILGLNVSMQNLEYWTSQSVYVSSRKLFGEIDFAYLRNESLIIRGWIFHKNDKINNLDIIVRGQKHRVVLKNESRHDVISAFPAEKHAFNSGFYLVVPWNNRALLRCSPKFIAKIDNEEVTGYFRSVDIENYSNTK